MNKKTFSIFAILLIMGMVFSFPLLIAQDNSGQGNNNDDIEDNDSDEVDEDDIINSIVSVDEDSDDENDSDEERDDDEVDEDETEVEIEMEIENGERKFKFKGKNVNAAQVRAALKERNRIGHNSTDLPENCTQTGAVIKCEAGEKLRTKVSYEGPLSSEELENLISDLKSSFDKIEGEIEVEIEVKREENETEFESSIEGNLTESQLELIEAIEIEMISLAENSDLEEVELELEIKNEYERNRIMSIFAGNSGNVIIQSKNTNASTHVELYHHNGEIYGVFGDNETRLINFLPDEIRERVREHIRARISENETEIELDEDGEYKVRTRKEARFLGLFKVKERMRLEVNPQTGEVLQERAPWWGFLAKDIENEDEFDSQTNTTETNTSA